MLAARSSRILVRSTINAVPRAAFSNGVSDAGSTWNKKEHAIEEQYFKKLDAQQRKSFAEKLHSKELKSLLAILPEKHGLTEEHIHKLLEWKHGKE